MLLIHKLCTLLNTLVYSCILAHTLGYYIAYPLHSLVYYSPVLGYLWVLASTSRRLEQYWTLRETRGLNFRGPEAV